MQGWRIFIDPATMTTSFDRRRANGPTETFQPLYDIQIEGRSSGNERVWNVDEHFVLRDPSCVCSDNFTLHTMKIGDDEMPVTCMAQKSVAKRPGNRNMVESRSICMFMSLI